MILRARLCLRDRPRVGCALAAFALLAIAGCTHTDPTSTGSIAAPVMSGDGSIAGATPTSMAGAGTVAFESVDGLPRSVFDRFVSALSAEAERRELPVVTRAGPSAYRVRAYLATYIEKKKKRATLAWTWDVLDTRDGSTFRLTGEEALGNPQRDVWAQVSDEVLDRVAVKALGELAARLGTPATPARPGALVAFTEAQ